MLEWLIKLFQDSSELSSEQRKPQNQYQYKARYPVSHLPIGRSNETSAVRSSVGVEQKSKARPLPIQIAVWMPLGKSVRVQNYLIPDGMIYVGTLFKGGGSHPQVDPCLVNPQLPAVSSNPDYEGNGMGYWPSYGEIPPTCRAAYLEWLATGRRNPKAYIGYIFLFFYGLERRVLRDYQTSKADNSEELAQIITEVEQLLKVYGHNDSFSSYSSQFLEICRLLQKSENLADIEPSLIRTSWQMPLGIKVALGRMAIDRKPISVDWMLSWYLHSERARLRTPATRCTKEFRQLLKLRYQQRYGEGMVIKPNKRKVKLEYRPASSGLSQVDLSSLNVRIGNLPDVTALSGPLNKLQALIDECTDALDPYSRWLGRNGENPDSKLALALLPPELVEGLKDEHIDKFKQWLAQTIEEKELVVSTGEQLLTHWDASAPSKLTKKESTILSQGLEKLGFGVEPDVRFGGKSLNAGSGVVLFKLKDKVTLAPSKEYAAAALLLYLAAAVAISDEVVDASEQQHLEEYLELALHLSPAERIRLKAHLAWLLQENLNLRGLKTKLSKLTSDERTGVANFLIGVAGADGHISPQEVSVLTKIYPLLGFETSEVYSHIHQLSTASQTQPAIAPVTVRPASQTSTGFAIPAKAKEPRSVPIEAFQSNSGFTLDLAAIQRKQAESAKVANLLGDLFDDDEPEPTSSDSILNTEPEVSIIGLDKLHSQFLLVIAQQSTWERNALESKADELGLMLDGALEVINDAAFEACDDPLTDGDDFIEIDANVLGELLP